jgi:acyl carrier protein
MSQDPYSMRGSVVDRLRAWLRQRNPALGDGDLDLDRDLIDTRALDSLSSLDFILFIEELAGCEIDTSAPGASMSLRTLRTIRDTYFPHVLEEIEAQPTSRTSLSAFPPRPSPEDGRVRRPLTHSQARYWYLQQDRPETAWNVPAMLRIKGPLDTSLLERVFAELVRRHDALRTTFEVVDGVPMQVVAPALRPEVKTSSVEDMPPSKRWRAALEVVHRECLVPIPLLKGLQWRAGLVRLEEGDHLCYMIIEHIAADFESLLALPVEIARLYFAAAEHRQNTLPVPPMQYSDFADWHADWLASDWGRDEIAYRRKQFEGAKPIDFGTGGRTATTSDRVGTEKEYKLSIESTMRLEMLAADSRATPVAVGMAAVATLLHRKFHQSDVVLMMVSSYRSPGRNTSGVVGNFTNQVPLRIAVSPTDTFRTLLKNVRNIVMEGIKYRDVPTSLIFDAPNAIDHPLAAAIVNWLNVVDTNEAFTPIVRNRVSMTPLMMGLGEAADAPLHGGNPPIATLVVRVVRTPQGLNLYVSTATEILKPPMADELAAELRSILDAAAANPDMLVGAGNAGAQEARR